MCADLLLDFLLSVLVLVGLVFFVVSLLLGFLKLHSGFGILRKLLFILLVFVRLSQCLLRWWSLGNTLLEGNLCVLGLFLDKAIEVNRLLLLVFWSTSMRRPRGEKGVDVHNVFQEAPLGVGGLHVGRVKHQQVLRG